MKILNVKDYFNRGDKETRILSEIVARDIAKKCGVYKQTKVIDYAKDGYVPVLHMEGTRIQLVKYYLKTLKYVEKGFKFKHIKRMFEILF